jgi:two-component system, LytTR family, response regulator LytT
MDIIIIEDESLAANKLERQILKIDESVVVLAKLESISDSVAWLKQNKCDLMFLDIHVSDGNSFKIFDEIDITTPIIFTTAYDQYAIQAFKVNSLDYLLKPINKADLARALDKYHSFLKNNPALPPVDFSALLSAMNKEKEVYKERFMIKSGGGKINIVAIEEVAYFFAEGKYTFLINKAGEEFLIDGTLEKLTNELNPNNFFRINRQFIIGITAIDKMHAWTKSRVKIELNPPSKQDTVVSVERSPEFKKWLDK